MNIACVMAPGRGDTDLLLSGVARGLLSAGYRPAGAVQINTERPCEGPCDMDVQVIPEGPVIRISQSLGDGSRGCRLDPEALETAVGHVEARLAEGADCLIVNKFGRHEAEGRGFRGAIAEALSLGIPVLVGLNGLNAPAFDEFTGGLAEQLEPEEAVLRGWLAARIETARQAA